MGRTGSSKACGRIVFFVMVGSCCLTTQGKYGGGNGTPEDPYQVRDANQICAIGTDANDWDKCFVLMDNIDLGGCAQDEFNPIGTSYSEPFTGVFDGNGHSICNFTCVLPEERYVGCSVEKHFF